MKIWKKKKKNFLKVFKERWYQSQENFNFAGRKINFQGWLRTMGIIFQRKFQISKKKKIIQRTTQINQGFPSKEKIQVKEKEREENHTSQNSGTTEHTSLKI